MIGATSLAYVRVAAEVAPDGSSDRKTPNAANAQSRQKPNAYFITNLLEQVKTSFPHMENDHDSDNSHICLIPRGARPGHRYFKNHSAAALAAVLNAAPLSTRVAPGTRATSVGPLSSFDAATATLSLFTLASFSAMTNRTAVFCGICSTNQNGRHSANASLVSTLIEARAPGR